MRLQVSPNGWSCLPTAFAIVLNIDVKDIFTAIGHDGSEIPPEFKVLPEPYCRRSFHIQELIKYALSKDRNVTKIDAVPVCEAKGIMRLLVPIDTAHQMFSDTLFDYDGVLTGINSDGVPHAIAWIDGKAIDPKTGYQTTLTSFAAQALYIIS